jgi:hypothetical protein
MAGLSLLAGCSKPAEKTQPGIDLYGVKVDVPRLQALLAGETNPEVRTNLAQVQFGIRYGDWQKAMTALERIAAVPSLTDPQRKVVNDVMGQIKQATGAAPRKPAS